MNIKEGSPTPWGPAQQVEQIAEGIIVVNTASHGGVWLSDKRRELIPMIEQEWAERWSGSKSWYEEDCCALIPLVQYETLWKEHYPRMAQRDWSHYRKALNKYITEYQAERQAV